MQSIGLKVKCIVRVAKLNVLFKQHTYVALKKYAKYFILQR